MIAEEVDSTLGAALTARVDRVELVVYAETSFASVN